MKMGFDQIVRATPAIVKNIRATLIYTLAGSLPFASILAPKFGIAITEYGSWIGFSILGIKAVSMLFGVTDGEVESEKQKELPPQ